MERRAAVEALEAIEASVAALAVLVRGRAASSESFDADPLRREADDWLDTLAEIARLEPKLAALKVHAATGHTGAAQAMSSPSASPQERTAQEMAVVAEVACVLTVTERAAGALLAQSHDLTTALPLTLAALQSGSISWQHARVMVEETTNLEPAAATALEAHFLDPEAPQAARGCPAGELVPSRFRHKARTWRERHHPVSIETRHAKSAEDRRLEYTADRDGMAWLSAYLPADQAAGIWNRATAAARALQGPHEARTLTQLRADAAADWLLSAGRESASGLSTAHPTAEKSTMGGAAHGRTAGTMGDVPSPAAQVLITVPVFSLLGLTDEPADLDGYGPIPPSMARRLIADGADSFHRVLTDPRTGAPLEIGRNSYRVPKTMRQWLRLRDGKCPFPGCNNHSLDNDADHLIAWADRGTTGITNLGQPCPKHHRLKHSSLWKPVDAGTDKPPGWISPTGRRYASEEQDWEPPHWPALAPLDDRPIDNWIMDNWIMADPGPAGGVDDLGCPPPPEDPFPDDAWPLPPEDPWSDRHAWESVWTCASVGSADTEHCG